MNNLSKKVKSQKHLEKDFLEIIDKNISEHGKRPENRTLNKIVGHYRPGSRAYAERKVVTSKKYENWRQKVLSTLLP
jgi:hypothetical protein